MIFSNKWLNLLFIVAAATVVTILFVKSMKVLDASGKDTGDKLAFKATA